MAPIIEVKQLVKKFGDFTAVKDISFGVAPGEIFAFLGPNGAGKSTTLRMLLGLVRPTSGTIKFPVQGSNWEYLRARSRVGAIVESPAFYENLSGRRNLQLLASLSGGAQSTRVDLICAGVSPNPGES